MDIIATKIIVAILFGLIRFAFGIFPIKIYAWLKTTTENGESVINENRRHMLEFIVTLVQSFGGGVLFATSFLHMMPEVYFSVEELKSYGVLGTDYPYSQLIISLGFFTIYFAEEISQWLISKAPKEPYRKRIEERAASSTTTISVNNKISPNFMKIRNGMAFEIEEKNEKNRIYLEKDDRYIEDELDAEVVVDSIDQACQTDHVQNCDMIQSLQNDLDTDAEVNAEIEEIIEEESRTQQHFLRCFLMVMALSLHAIFEGLAIGLQRSVTNIWYLFIAVSVHSASILFVMGLEIVLSGTTTKTTMIHMSMLSGTSPFGVLLGLIITLTTDLQTSAKSFAIILLEGLSAGTILYITFFETLSREKERRSCRVARAASIGAGFALMAALQCLKLGT